MSLLEEAMEPFVILNKTTTLDEYGGFVYTWTEGAEFQGALADMSPSQVLVAQQRDTHASYKLFTEKAINLMEGDIVQRKATGTYFRITTDGTDQHTPQSAPLDARTVSAELLKTLPV